MVERMPHKLYLDVAAARHMKTTVSPPALPEPADVDPAEARRAKPARGDAPARRGKAVKVKSPRSAEYRRQRLIALSLVSLTALTVPSLSTLLVLFG